MCVSAGPASDAPGDAARLLFAPNTTAVTGLMLLLAKAAACPPGGAISAYASSSASFYHFFAASAKAAAAEHPECASGGADACRAQPACYLPLYQRQLAGHASAEEAAAAAAAQPGTVDALLDFTAWQQALDARQAAPGQGRQQAGTPEREPAQRQPPRWRLLEAAPQRPPRLAAQRSGQEGDEEEEGGEAWQQALLGREAGGQRWWGVGSPLVYSYTLRMNHSEVPPTRMLLNQVGLKRGTCGLQAGFGCGPGAAHGWLLSPPPSPATRAARPAARPTAGACPARCPPPQFDLLPGKQYKQVGRGWGRGALQWGRGGARQLRPQRHRPAASACMRLAATQQTWPTPVCSSSCCAPVPPAVLVLC